MTTIEDRRRWANALIRRCPDPPPSYGTAAWLALPEGSAARIASAVIASESWATEGDHLEDRMRAEIEGLRIGHKREEDAEYCARRDAWRDEQSRRGYRPHPANRHTDDDENGRRSA